MRARGGRHVCESIGRLLRARSKSKSESEQVGGEVLAAAFFLRPAVGVPKPGGVGALLCRVSGATTTIVVVLVVVVLLLLRLNACRRGDLGGAPPAGRPLA